MCRYATYKCGVAKYTIEADIKGFPNQSGEFYVENVFPGKQRPTDYQVGYTWWSDRTDASLYSSRQKCQGAETVAKWRIQVMEDWGKRCGWLR